jgi:hypothetical protein
MEIVHRASIKLSGSFRQKGTEGKKTSKGKENLLVIPGKCREILVFQTRAGAIRLS